MFAVLYVPDFLLQAQLRDPHEIKPTALAEKSSGSGAKTWIIALNTAARAMKIEIGMTVAQGQARCGDLIVLHRSEKAEQETQEALLRQADSWTPDFEETGQGISTLDLMGLRFDSEWELGWGAVEQLAAEHSLRVQVGFAETPDLALLVAKQADPVRSVFGDENRDFLLQLPMETLDPLPDMAMVLALWGIATVGDFLALPGDEVSERLGPDALDLRDLVLGKKSRLLRLVRRPKDFSQAIEFEYEVETLEPLLFTMRRVLETICTRLNSAWLCAGEIHLQLHFSKGSAYQRSFRVPDPSTDVELLFRILHAHLEGFIAKSPIIELRLEANPARPLRRQMHMFESGLSDPNRFAETLARLEALLGSENVGIPEPSDTHRPDSFQMRPFQESKVFESPNQSPRIGLPLRRFRPPVFADVRVCSQKGYPVEIRTPMVQGAIREHRGPWLASDDWWRGKNDHNPRWSRVEWDIEIINRSSGGLYLLVHEKEGGWKLEGVYG